MTADSEFYPENPCSEAPLRPGEAPIDGCPCKVCIQLRVNSGPVRPGTPEWDYIVRLGRPEAISAD